jgi:hypothetical protein
MSEISLLAYEGVLRLPSECHCGVVYATTENNCHAATLADIAAYLTRKGLWDELLQLRMQDT